MMESSFLKRGVLVFVNKTLNLFQNLFTIVCIQACNIILENVSRGLEIFSTKTTCLMESR